MQNMPVYLKSLITLCHTVTDTAMHWLGGALAVGVGLPVQHIITRFARRVNSLAEVQSTVGHDVEPDGGDGWLAATSGVASITVTSGFFVQPAVSRLRM